MNTYSSLSNRPRVASSFKLMAAFLLLALCTFTMVPSVWSQGSAAPPSSASTEGGTPSDAGMLAMAGLSTLLYFPLKAVFAISGGIVGGLAYVFSGGSEQRPKTSGTPVFTVPTSLPPITYEAIGPSVSWGSLIRTPAPAPCPNSCLPRYLFASR